MNRIKRIYLEKNVLKIGKDYLSLIAIGTIVLGYLSFYSYAARYSISYVSPSITFISGLGIVCLVLLFVLYLIAKQRSIYRGIRVLLLIFFLNLITENPILMFAGVYYFLDQDFRKMYRKPIFKKLKARYLKYNRNDRIATFIVSTFFFILGIFFNLKIFVVYIFLDSCILQFQIAILYRPRILNLILMIILLPIFVFGYFIENSDYTIFGIAQQTITITKKDSTILQGTLIYKDDYNLYLKDSSRTSNNSIDAAIFYSTVIKLDEVQSYKSIQKKDNSKYHKGLINLFKQNK